MTSPTLPSDTIRQPLDRREFLHLTAGGVALSAAPHWLTAAEPPGRHKACIVVYLSGGLSHLESFDWKPGVSEFQQIPTSVPGTQICDVFPKLAALMNQVALVRSMSTPENDHIRANYYAHTCQKPGGVVWPSLGAIIGKELGKPDAPLPNYVVIGDPGFSDDPGGSAAGFLGPQYQPVKLRYPERGLDNLKPFQGDLKRHEQRARLLLESDKAFLQAHQSAAAQAHAVGVERTARLMQSRESAAFDISQEPAAVREAYGDSHVGKGCLLARRLVQTGVPFVEVTHNGWDWHELVTTLKVKDKFFPPADTAISTLIGDLKERGLLDSTLVVVMGEFGHGGTTAEQRNVAFNRNHWCRAWSTLLVGGGVKGGGVIGKTDRKGAEVEERPVSMPDFFATIYKVLGIDYTKELMAGDRPVRMVDKGEKPISEILPA